MYFFLVSVFRPLLFSGLMLVVSAPSMAQAQAGSTSIPSPSVSTLSTGNGATGSIGEDEIDRRTQSISDSVMSPFCPGRTLSACPSDKARLLKGEIRTWVAKGATLPEVEKRLVAVYDDVVLAIPREQGFGKSAFLVPAAFVALGLVAIIFFSRAIGRRNATQTTSGSTSPGSSSVNPAVGSDAALLNQVEAELQKRLQR